MKDAFQGIVSFTAGKISLSKLKKYNIGYFEVCFMSDANILVITVWV